MKGDAYNSIMRIDDFNSRIDAFLLTVDFSKLDQAWFAQFDKEDDLSGEIKKLFEKCIADLNVGWISKAGAAAILGKIKSRIESHKQQFDAVVRDEKKIDFDSDVRTQLMMNAQSHKGMLNPNVLCYQLCLNSQLEKGRKNAFFKLIDNPSIQAALLLREDLSKDQKQLAFSLFKTGAWKLKSISIFGDQILEKVKNLISSDSEFLKIWKLLNDGTDGRSIFSADLSAEIKKVFAQSISDLGHVVRLLSDKEISESDRKIIAQSTQSISNLGDVLTLLSNTQIDKSVKEMILGAVDANNPTIGTVPFVLKKLLLYYQGSKQNKGSGSQPNIGLDPLLEILQSYETSKENGFGAMLRGVYNEMEASGLSSFSDDAKAVQTLKTLNSKLISKAPIGFNRDGLRTLIEKCKRMYQGASYGGDTLEEQFAKLHGLAKLTKEPIMKSGQGELTKPKISHASVSSNSLSAAPNPSTAQRTAEQPLLNDHGANRQKRP